MVQREIVRGNRKVVITRDEGAYDARLFVRAQGSEWAAGHTCWEGKTHRGAEDFALQALGLPVLADGKLYNFELASERGTKRQGLMSGRNIRHELTLRWQLMSATPARGA